MRTLDDIAMGGTARVTGLNDPAATQDAVNRQSGDARYVPLTAPVVAPNVATIVNYGHSLLSAAGTTDPDRDVGTHLASMLKIREKPLAVAGAVLGADQTVPGGYAHVFQNDLRPSRPSTTLSAVVTAGSTTALTVASTVGMVVGNMLMVGTGATGAGGGEILWVTAVTDATHLAFVRADGSATTSLRSHAIGDPVYVVPSDYIVQNAMYLHWYGGNDLARSPITSAATIRQETFKSPLRSIIARHRCAEIFEDSHSSCVYTNSWTVNSGTTGSGSGTGNHQANTAGGGTPSTVTLHTPDNFPGGADGLSGVIDLCFESGQTGTSPTVWTFTVDGVAAGTLNMGGNITGFWNAAVKRLTGLTAGRHVIVATLTTLAAGDLTFFDWWGIEAAIPPFIIELGAARAYSYAGFAGLANAPKTTTLTGLHNSGVSSFTVASTAGWLAGSRVGFELGTGNEETLEVNAVTSGTTFTTTTPSTKSHTGATAVVDGAQDADFLILNTMIQAVIAEFDSQVQFVDTDALFNKNPAMIYYDALHLNDKFHSALTKLVYDKVRANFSTTEASYISAPSAPLPSCLNFTQSSGTLLTAATPASGWFNMPLALTELYGLAAHRKLVDLRRCFEARFVVGVQVVGVAGSSLRIQYSLDGGTTWKYLFRTTTYAEDTSHEALLTTVGMRDSGWRPIAAEALVDNLWLRIVGINGNATADPTFGTIDLYFR